jgi:HK97 family phage major capsid protein
MTTVTLPTSQAEFEEALHDKDRMKAVWSEGEQGWQDFVKGYAKASLETAAGDPTEIAKQMREAVQLGHQEFLQNQAAQGIVPRAGFRPGGSVMGGWDDRKARAVARSRRPDAGYQVDNQLLFSADAAGAKLDKEPYGGSFGEFFHAVFLAEDFAKDHGDTGRLAAVQGYKRSVHNALTERVGSEGGFLVPEVLRSEVLMVSLEKSVMRPRARIIPMDSLRVPLPSIDDTSHQNNVYGGVQGYWTEESGTLQLSAPSFGRVLLEAKKLTAFTAVPNELLKDAVTPLDTWFRMFFPEALAWFEDIAFISGTGVGEPEGILSAPGAVRVPVATVNTITFTEVAKAYTRMWPRSLGSAVWLCSPDALLQLILLAMTVGGTGIAPPLFLEQMQAQGYPGGGNGDGVSYRLMGRPLIVTEKMPSSTSGNTTVPGALMFVDPSYYLIGDRQAMQIASSDEYYFANDMMAYRVIQRLDGRLWFRTPITPQNGSSQTLSPAVKIDTTSTS